MTAVTAPQATVHASAVAIGEAGILIRGASGSGKSALALALIAADPARTRLIADDRVAVAAWHGRVVAFAPPAIAGLLEVRGQGVVALPYLSPAVLRLVVDIVAADRAPRLPADAEAEALVEGISLPRLALPAAAPDGALRVRLAAERLARGGRERRAAEMPLALRNRSVEIGRPAGVRPRVGP